MQPCIQFRKAKLCSFLSAFIGVHRRLNWLCSSFLGIHVLTVSDFGNIFFLNEFLTSSVISSEALGLEARLKVLGDQLTKT